MKIWIFYFKNFFLKIFCIIIFRFYEFWTLVIILMTLEFRRSFIFVRARFEPLQWF